MAFTIDRLKVDNLSETETSSSPYNYVKFGYRVYEGELQMRDDGVLETDASELHWDESGEVLRETT